MNKLIKTFKDVFKGKKSMQAGMQLLDLTRQSRASHHDKCLQLIRNGADLSVHTEHFERTALIIATTYNNTKLAQALLDHGADVNATDCNGNTALIYAASTGYLDMIRILLDHGANINATNDEGNTALMIAAEGKAHRLPALSLLVERGADTAAIETHEDANLKAAIKEVKKRHLISALKSADQKGTTQKRSILRPKARQRGQTP